jgi:adenylate kinase family enzyme
MPRRIHIMGTSGSGKTHLGRRLARALAVPHVELDGLYHGPNWAPAEPARFQADVQELAETDAWIADGNYPAARDVLWRRAELVVFLDVPRWRVITQLAARSFGRVARGTTLWNGNRERWRDLVQLDPSNNVLLWSWLRYGSDRDAFRAAATDLSWSRVRFAWVRSADEALRVAQS